jgi:hypothetical protein
VGEILRLVAREIRFATESQSISQRCTRLDPAESRR